MWEIIPKGSQGKVWFVEDSKTHEELGWSFSLVELTQKFGKQENVTYGMRWYFPNKGVL